MIHKNAKNTLKELYKVEIEFIDNLSVVDARLIKDIFKDVIQDTSKEYEKIKKILKLPVLEISGWEYFEKESIFNIIVGGFQKSEEQKEKNKKTLKDYLWDDELNTDIVSLIWKVINEELPDFYGQDQLFLAQKIAKEIKNHKIDLKNFAESKELKRNKQELQDEEAAKLGIIEV